MDSEESNEECNDSLKDASRRFRQICLKIAQKNQQRRKLFPDPQPRLPLRPSIIDRACLKQAVISSTPMTCTKNKAFRFNSVGSLSSIDDGEQNPQPVNVPEQNQSVIELSSVEEDVKINHCSRDDERELDEDVTDAKIGKSKNLENIISKLVQTEPTSESVHIRNRNISNKTVQTTLNSSNAGSIKKLARCNFQLKGRARQTQTGSSLQGDIERNQNYPASRCSSTASEASDILHSCDEQPLIVNRTSEIKLIKAERLFNLGAPWRPPSGLQEPFVPATHSFTAGEETEEDLDDTFLPKPSKQKKVFVNNKKLAKDKRRSSAKKTREKSVTKQPKTGKSNNIDQGGNLVGDKSDFVTPRKIHNNSTCNKSVAKQPKAGKSNNIDQGGNLIGDKSDCLRARKIHNNSTRLEEVAAKIARANESNLAQIPSEFHSGEEKTKTKNSAKEKNEKPVSAKAKSTVSVDKESNTKSQESHLFDDASSFLRSPNQKKKVYNRLEGIAHKIAQANKNDVGQCSYSQFHADDEESQMSEQSVKAVKKKKRGARNKPINEANCDESLTEGRLDNTGTTTPDRRAGNKHGGNTKTKSTKTSKQKKPIKDLEKSVGCQAGSTIQNGNNKNNTGLEDEPAEHSERTEQVKKLAENSRQREVKKKNGQILEDNVDFEQSQQNTTTHKRLNKTHNLTQEITCPDISGNLTVPEADVIANVTENAPNFYQQNTKKKQSSKKKHESDLNRTRNSSNSNQSVSKNCQVNAKRSPRKNKKSSNKKKLTVSVDSNEVPDVRRSQRSRRPAVKMTAGVLVMTSQTAYDQYMKEQQLTKSSRVDIKENIIGNNKKARVSRISSRRVSRKGRTLSTALPVPEKGKTQKKSSLLAENRQSTVANNKARVSKTSSRKASSKATTASTIFSVPEEENQGNFETSAVFDTTAAGTSEKKKRSVASGKITKRRSSKTVKKKIRNSLENITNSMSNIANICDGDKVRSLKWFQNLQYKEVKNMPGVSTSFLDGVSPGMLKIAAGRSKPKQMALYHLMIFFILKGRAEVGVQDKSSICEEGSSFIVPPGGEYYVKNLGVDTELILYFTKFPK